MCNLENSTDILQWWMYLKSLKGKRSPACCKGSSFTLIKLANSNECLYYLIIHPVHLYLNPYIKALSVGGSAHQAFPYEHLILNTLH